MLDANHIPMPVHMDDHEGVSMAPNSSIVLDGKGINDEDDGKQEV